MCVSYFLPVSLLVKCGVHFWPNEPESSANIPLKEVDYVLHGVNITFISFLRRVRLGSFSTQGESDGAQDALSSPPLPLVHLAF